MTRSPGYALELPPEAVDLVRFERLRQEGRAALRPAIAGRAAAAAARGAGAVARPGPRGVRGAVRRDRVGSARGAASRLHSRTASRPTSSSGAHGAPDRRARGARGPQSAARAACAASSCWRCTAPAGRRTRSPATGFSESWLDRARHRALADAARARAPDPAARPDARGSRTRPRRTPSRSRPERAVRQGTVRWSEPMHLWSTTYPGAGSGCGRRLASTRIGPWLPRDEELTLELERSCRRIADGCSGRSRPRISSPNGGDRSGVHDPGHRLRPGSGDSYRIRDAAA